LPSKQKDGESNSSREANQMKALFIERLSIVMLAAHTAFGLFFLFVKKDHEHSMMFFSGAILWVIVALIWINNAERNK
jgi:hypothetical protein